MQEQKKKCASFSTVWIIVVNSIFFLFGLIMIGLASWGISHEDDNMVTQVLPAGSLRTLVAVGVFLVLVALAGCAGVKFNYTCCGRATLGIYATSLIILTIMEWAAAGTVVTFTSKLDDFGPTQAYKDLAVYRLVNQSYTDCCCAYRRCPNETCWLPGYLLYPCDSIDTFSQFLDEYISDKLIPIAVIAILLSLLQLMTAITACCSQCKGKAAAAAKKFAPQPMYDGQYDEPDYGYDAYVKGGVVGARPGSAAAGGNPNGPTPSAGATAPKVGGGPGGRGPTPVARAT